MASLRKIRLADTFLTLVTIFLLLENGAALWETVNIVPIISKAPPVSFHIFQGEYGLRYAGFWVVTHTIIELLFIVALILNWKHLTRRKMLIAVFGTYIFVRIWTIVYFAPTMMSFWEYPFSNTLDELLKRKVKTWEILSLIRTIIMFILPFVILPFNKKVYTE